MIKKYTLTYEDLKQRELLNERLKGINPKEHNLDDCANPILGEDNPFLPHEAMTKTLIDSLNKSLIRISADVIKKGDD